MCTEGAKSFKEMLTEKTYQLQGRCSNCGFQHTRAFTYGEKPKTDSECPHCGCMDMQYGPVSGPTYIAPLQPTYTSPWWGVQPPAPYSPIGGYSTPKFPQDEWVILC